MTTTNAAPNDPAVCAGFSAGWLIAQLHGPILTRPVTAEAPLPTVRELARADRVALTFDQLDALLAGPLGSPLAPQHGQPVVTTETLRGAWNADKPDSLDDLQTAVRKLHAALLERLTVADSAVGSAYSLGRSLSDSCWLPHTRDDFEHEFNKYRLANLQSWLADLAPRLPRLAAAAVSAGLDHWAAWLSVHGNLDWNSDGPAVQNAARAQGERWRSLLAGDKEPASLLSPEGYVEAGEAALRRAGTIIRRAVVAFWIPLAVVGLATALALFLSIRYSSGTAKVWTSIVSLAAGLGVTGKGLQSATKRLAADASKPLLELADGDAIAWAATCLPAITTSRGQQRRLRQQGVAPSSGLYPNPSSTVL
jgi:hypothetical protein